jgi:penicillin-binding protein 1C
MLVKISTGKKRVLKYIIAFLVIILFWPLWGRMFLPSNLFNEPYSTIVYDRNGELLGARISEDEQWRFPPPENIPEKYEKAVVLFEDKNFYKHPGFDVFSLAKALMTNIKAGKTVRGGSTLTMQVIRLMRKHKKRTVKEKLIEIALSIVVEFRYSKDEILKMYAAHAPYGGNVVGLDAACWRWFGHSSRKITWAQAATLAVLPNAPSLINPGKNRSLLLKKRNRLLKRLFEKKIIDKMTYELSILEEIPEKPRELPQITPHLTAYFQKNNKGERVVSTIDKKLQIVVNRIVSEYHKKYSSNEIRNMAVLVLKTSTKEAMAYAGNVTDSKSKGFAVDMVRAQRSTGSILKPLLYAAAIDDGQILINSLIPDIPSYFKNYHPQNYDYTFEGAVPAAQALSRSRNVPAIYLLRDYGITRFLDLLHQTGFYSFDKSADYYGLSLILGGGEASLWEITSMYAGMSQLLLHYDDFYGKYNGHEFDKPVIMLKNVTKNEEPNVTQPVPVHAGAVWETWQALYKVHRPEEQEGWEYFGNNLKIAWKTGTSYGFRDAWAVGSTADYVVGVWVGNADGEGRYGLTGAGSAAPVMFDVFNKLKIEHDFHRPEDEMTEIAVCKKSGYRASAFCPDVDTILAYKKGINVKQCTYHRKIFTDLHEKYRLYKGCASDNEIKSVSWFVLPPVQEWYYRKSHPSYMPLPPFRNDCNASGNKIMQFVYPQNNEKLFVVNGVNGKPKPIVFELTHHNPATKIFWHIDKEYLGITQNNHKMAFVPPAGYHTLTVVDQNGNSTTVRFFVERRD